MMTYCILVVGFIFGFVVSITSTDTMRAEWMFCHASSYISIMD